jgi:hypothetical protein
VSGITPALRLGGAVCVRTGCRCGQASGAGAMLLWEKILLVASLLMISGAVSLWMFG